jgi:oleate hydratase
MPRSSGASRPAAFDRETGKVHLIGGGIASMAAAAFMIRDGDVLGRNITIYEELACVGGSLDGAGDAESGYVLRGGRMIESKYVCTFDLFAGIPTLDGKTTVSEEIIRWNQTLKTSSKSRLVRAGLRQTAPAFGLSEHHVLTIERLVLEPEVLLGQTTIAEQFDARFFATDFWAMWSTTFAFQPWHSAVELKRYLARFAHMVDGFDRLQGIMRTVYNQYDSMVLPLAKFLKERGVRVQFGTRVTDLTARAHDGRSRVTQILVDSAGAPGAIDVTAADCVLVTLGSMTDGSSLGSMAAPPVLKEAPKGAAWALWDTLAQGRRGFGRPDVFDSHVPQSKWMSFTTTVTGTAFLRAVLDITGNVPGEGGLVTFPDSPWLASIVIPHQPHFIGQKAGVSVFWGYGLAVDKIGEFVHKPMSACSGQEIMTEILGHLRLLAEAAVLMPSFICIPCMMPFITSQFMPRAQGDRPQVIPEGWDNLAFLGQFVEIPQDVVFTVEYSIRSAALAAYALLGLKRAPPAVYQGKFDPRVLFKAFMALHDFHAPVAVEAAWD